MKKTFIFSLFLLSASFNSGAANYSEKAWVMDKSGSVTLSFFVDEKGKATDISVIKSEPKGFFERSAISALKEKSFDSIDYGKRKEITVKFQK